HHPPPDLFNNGGGKGTATHDASAAAVSHPNKEGLVQGFSVYVDTLFVCTATAFMILFTGQFNVADPDGGFLVQNLGEKIQAGPEYTQLAVARHFPMIGDSFVARSEERRVGKEGRWRWWRECRKREGR